jgi:hypothetical protein
MTGHDLMMTFAMINDNRWYNTITRRVNLMHRAGIQESQPNNRVSDSRQGGLSFGTIWYNIVHAL